MEDLSALVSLLILVITWLIVQPLKTSINNLRVSVDRLTAVVDENQHEINELRERVARVESSAKSAHSRLDDFQTRLAAAESSCQRRCIK